MNEHIKGPWHSDGKHVRNEGGLIATAMTTVRLSGRIDETRLDGESWLAMRGRTEHLREENKEIEKDLLTLIAAAPDMLEVLNMLHDLNSSSNCHDWDELYKKSNAILKSLHVRKGPENGK